MFLWQVAPSPRSPLSPASHGCSSQKSLGPATIFVHLGPDISFSVWRQEQWLGPWTTLPQTCSPVKGEGAPTQDPNEGKSR